MPNRAIPNRAVLQPYRRSDWCNASPVRLRRQPDRGAHGPRTTQSWTDHPHRDTSPTTLQVAHAGSPVGDERSQTRTAPDRVILLRPAPHPRPSFFGRVKAPRQPNVHVRAPRQHVHPEPDERRFCSCIVRRVQSRCWAFADCRFVLVPGLLECRLLSLRIKEARTTQAHRGSQLAYIKRPRTAPNPRIVRSQPSLTNRSLPPLSPRRLYIADRLLRHI